MKTMNQTELAERIGISRTYLNGILNGTIKPSIETAKKISKLTGKPFFELRPDLKKLVKEYL